MISDRKQYIGIKNNIVFELFQFLFMLEWFLACISRFSAHIPTSFSVFMPNICCLDKLDNKHYAYRLIMMWEYGQKNEKYWPGSIPAHIRIGKVLNVVIFDTNNCLFYVNIEEKATGENRSFHVVVYLSTLQPTSMLGNVYLFYYYLAKVVLLSLKISFVSITHTTTKSRFHPPY